MGDIQRSGTDAFARLLTEARERAGLSRRELAEQTGLSYPYISQLETGYRGPSPEAMQRLTDVLGVPVQDMVAAMAERDAPSGRPNRQQHRTAKVYEADPAARPDPAPDAVADQPHGPSAPGSAWVSNPSWSPQPARLSVPAPAPLRSARPPASEAAVPLARSWARHGRLRPGDPGDDPAPAEPPVPDWPASARSVAAGSRPDVSTLDVVADVLARLDQLPPEDRLAALVEIQNRVVRTVVADSSAPEPGR